MTKKFFRQLSLALPLVLVAFSANHALAQSASSPSTNVVTGTDPEPQTVVALVVLSIILGS